MVNRKIIIRTKRLTLHEMTTEDAEAVYNLNSDPEVIKYTGDPPFESVNAAVEFLKGYSDYRIHGMGRWAVRSRENDEFVGWCGLKRHSNTEVDLGFRFFVSQWNKGFASEAGMACLEFGFTHHSLPYIIGRVMSNNRASVRVLQKLGMTYWKPIECEEHPADCYRIDAQAWTGRLDRS